MNKQLITVALIAASALSQAFSFAGDWTFNSDATLIYNTTLGSGSYNDAGSSLVTATQVTINDFSFPVNFGGLNGSGDFVVSGTTVTDINGGQTTDPFDVPFGTGTVTIRATYPTWILTGTVDGTDPGNINAFGEYATHITGDSVTVSNVQLEAFLFGSWVDLGSNNSFTINSWSLEREAVPEPATLTILGLAALVAMRKKNQS